VEVATAMYELIHEESREVIVRAFIEGANLTPKGAQTYFYNCKRKFRKPS
jgi:bisphosphoglycerate-independent phosphoglycerate mutase (AlkP superfamily)